jgi:hypothetical protein
LDNQRCGNPIAATNLLYNKLNIHAAFSGPVLLGGIQRSFLPDGEKYDMSSFFAIDRREGYFGGCIGYAAAT